MVSEYPWAFLVILPFVGLLKVLDYLLILAVLMVVLLSLEGTLRKTIPLCGGRLLCDGCKTEWVYPLKWVMCSISRETIRRFKNGC